MRALERGSKPPMKSDLSSKFCLIDSRTTVLSSRTTCLFYWLAYTYVHTVVFPAMVEGTTAVCSPPGRTWTQRCV